MNHECPFCKSGTQSLGFASAEEFLAIYNISPILPGHSLVMPVKHAKSLFDLNEDEISGFFTFARKVTAFLCDVYNCEAYDWSLQEGMEAGQSVDHLHLHIIPRKPGDLNKDEDWYGKLQQSIDPANKERIIIPEREHRQISVYLKEQWEVFKT